MGWRRRAVIAAATLAAIAGPAAAQAPEVRLPVLVPLTGFVALEGVSPEERRAAGSQPA